MSTLRYSISPHVNSNIRLYAMNILKNYSVIATDEQTVDMHDKYAKIFKAETGMDIFDVIHRVPVV